MSHFRNCIIGATETLHWNSMLPYVHALRWKDPQAEFASIQGTVQLGVRRHQNVHAGQQQVPVCDVIGTDEGFVLRNVVEKQVRVFFNLPLLFHLIGKQTRCLYFMFRWKIQIRGGQDFNKTIKLEVEWAGGDEQRYHLEGRREVELLGANLLRSRPGRTPAISNQLPTITEQGYRRLEATM